MRFVVCFVVDCGTRERIESMATEVAKYVEAGYGIVIVTHLGRPKGVYNAALSTATIVQDVTESLGVDPEKIMQLEDFAVSTLQDAKTQLDYRRKDVVILQNVRMDARDQSANADERMSFAQQILLSLCPYLVLWDNLPTAHRLEAYTCEIPICAKKHHIAVKTGANVSTELKAIDEFLATIKEEDHIVGLFGGVKVEEKAPFAEWCKTTYYPNSFVAATGKWATEYDPKGKDIYVTQMRDGDLTLGSINRIIDEIQQADVIIHCGTPGNIKQGYIAATYAIWGAIVDAVIHRRVRLLLCGGDTASEFTQFLRDVIGENPKMFKRTVIRKKGFISDSGGAAIEHMMGKRLPGLEACGYYDNK